MTQRDDLDATIAEGDAVVTREDTTIDRGTRLGRYVVLAELGRGSMGVVHAAYDPELDRKVAIKLLRKRTRQAPVASDAPSRLLREAQALAKLAHPNVVAIYDVGTKDDRVWLAMEFVEGRTLGQWLQERPRPWREILDVIIRAGRGLAAAHAVGLLHRDFKPDNVMIGVDGRVRVMDFGLARAIGTASELSDPGVPPDSDTSQHRALSIPMTQTGALMGTPAYMAPEQIRGMADERSDQFSLCVTMWEALFGQRPFTADTVAGVIAAVLRGELQAAPRRRRVPRWLRRVCLRGLSADRADRFESIEAMLTAINRGRVRARIGWFFTGLAIVGLIATSFAVVRRYEHAARVADCEAAGADIEEVWSEPARERVREGLLATGAANATTTIARVMPWLDAQAQAWREHRTSACMRANVVHSWDRQIHERAIWCLEERRLQLASTVAQLEIADPRMLQAAVPAASSLSAISPCLEAAVLEHLPSPPSDTDRELFAELLAASTRIDALTVAGKEAEASALLDATKRRAAALAWPPFEARLHAHDAALSYEKGAFADSERASIDAYLLAVESGAWELAASTATRLVHTVGYRQARHAEGRLWARLAEVAESYAGDPEHLREATRLGNLAGIEYEAGAYDEGIRLGERALALRTHALGDDHPMIATTLANLAILYQTKGQLERAEDCTRRALAIQETALGNDHPDVARTLNNLAVMLRQQDRLAEAKALIERALSIRERVLEASHPDLAASFEAIGSVVMAMGELDRARDYQQRALEIRERSLDPDHPDIAKSLNNLANVYSAEGDPHGARALYERARGILLRGASPDHYLAGNIATNLAATEREIGDLPRAAQVYEEAIAALERSMGPDHESVATASAWLGRTYFDLRRYDDAIAPLERSLATSEDAQTRFYLARAMLAAGRERPLALAEARRARDVATDQETSLRAAIDAWLSKHATKRPRSGGR